MLLLAAALLAAVLGACGAQAKAVFAHFMVGNTASFDVARWTDNINLAKQAHIDAFALNIAYGWEDNEKQLSNAFAAAAPAGFKLFFSFDYAGGTGPWPLDKVRTLIRTYGKHAAHYQYNGLPLVSTFEGPDQADDWHTINSGDTSCFFIPDWSSLGAGPAVAAGNGVANGLFSWAAWPTGLLNTTTYVDASYKLALGNKPYMMPVSPWFFTNMPGFDKNWLWNSGDLWHQRWQQILGLDFEPEFLQIISWNDYGESHYIGPLDDTQYEAFDRGKAPYNYVKNMPHDGWREHLPYLIDLYKTGTATFTRESLVTWFRTSLEGACADGGTTGNTASQLQLEHSPQTLMRDRLYFSALLTSYAELRVTYGGTNYVVKNWDATPDGGVGIYHTSIPISTTSGAWSAAIVRNGVTIIDYDVPQGVSASCPNGITNWNPWVGSKQGSATVSGKPPRTIAEQECVEGWGPDNFRGLCSFTCSYGYCPSGACVCTNNGGARTKPNSTGVRGYPANGDANYGGLCSFACNFGFCPEHACSTTEQAQYIPETSPFNPLTCTGGWGSDSTSRLCSWACRYGFCPIRSCTCSFTGPLTLPPPVVDVGKVNSNFGNDNGLCNFACKRGYCPSPECESEKGEAAGSDSVDTVVAYFQARHIPTRGCNKRPASFVPTDSVTHINVAFLWVDPDSFAVYPSRGFDTAQIQEITSLKRQAPGLRVWISVGGWDFSNGKGASPGTQAIFGELAANPANRAKFIANLAMFMRQYALDGVDIDWEWPGTTDAANYAALVQDMRLYFDANQPAGLGWGISFTAPVDTAILERYDLTTMIASANWVNLVAYDLTSIDSTTTRPSSDVRRFDAALAVFSEASVPTSRINLGLGFFGRSYTLSSDSCSTLNCASAGGGVVGPCSGTAGFMSYKEIDQMISNSGYRGQYDGDVGTNFFTYGDKQWISYDNPESIIEKVKYAKTKGLLGLTVWSIELDNDAHDLLNATLFPVGLGGLADQTGSGAGDSSDHYDDITVSSCSWSTCSASENPGCPAGQQVLTVNRCDAELGTGKKRYKALCCPLDKTPDPDFCEWQGFSQLAVCTSGCSPGYVGMADDDWIINPGGEGRCFFGRSTYCCKVEQTGPALCGWEKRCVSIGADERPTAAACPSATKFVTYAKGVPALGRCEGDEGVNSWIPYCCNTQVDTSSFEWAGAKGQATYECPNGCPSGKTMISTSELGGGADCYVMYDAMDPLYSSDPIFYHTPRPLCADPNALRLTVNTLPVPLKNLFPTPGPDTDKQKWHVELDPSMGGADPTPETSLDPDDNSFGWYIMSGPASELTSLNRRDGSHWELVGCDDAVDSARRYTVRAVCTTEGEQNSNCGDIYQGDGVADTVVEMPPSCGPGKYAMAVSLVPSTNQTLPPHLTARRPGTQVYDFTFDFDFSRLQKRESNVLLRIDYSDDPGYWSTIVAAAPSKRRKRSLDEIHSEVKRDHGGSYKRYLNHLWEEDKRLTPAHELHELHARWFSGEVADWIAKMRGVNVEYNLVRHRVDQTMRWDLVDESVQCDFDNGVSATGRFKAWTDLSVNIETSAMLTLIGNLGDLSSFDQSHILFRNRGSVKASFNLDALATVSFMTGTMELFGLQNFGATFSVPGIVTIGPNFRVLGSVEGSATLHGEARVDIKLADWDYTQQYPDKNGGGDGAITNAKAPGSPSVAAADPDDPVGTPKFYYDVDARGQLTVTVTPQVTLGIVFTDSRIPDASIDLGVNGRVVLYGSAGSSSDEAWRYCYGVNANVDVFARISAPKLFKVDISNYYTIWRTGTFPVVAEVCAAAGASAAVASSPRAMRSTVASSGGSGPLAKRDSFLGSLLCPKDATDLSDLPDCPACGEDQETSSLALRSRFGTMMEARAESCLLVESTGEETCEPTDDGSAAKRDASGAPGHGHGLSDLAKRSLQEKKGQVILGGISYVIGFGQYAPCSDATTSGNILKNIIVTNNKHACTADIGLLPNVAIAKLNTGKPKPDRIKLNTDHVFETQIIARFIEFLAGGATGTKVNVGTYTMASADWVNSVIFGDQIVGRTSFELDMTKLNFSPQRANTKALFWVLVCGVGRSDGNQDQNQGCFTKVRGESHLVLLDERINAVKGSLFKLQNPSLLSQSQVRTARFQTRNSMAIFEYLKWTPKTPANAQFAAAEPVWHKFMRVTNWIDLVCYYADEQIDWSLADGPKNSAGKPSLRALWVHFIEDYLEQIEAKAGAWAQLAASDYAKYHASKQGEPAWSKNAFGAGGWATRLAARLPRVPATGNGWSQYGVFGNPDMTIDGSGKSVRLPRPGRVV
ncbi:glycoside hydrolase family 18 protein [Parathielavia hyrcaniae]|uniref:chitinase n=1 Tax=Parathielavia hyrcaniae TaxID=113614 RepID=A0AAN6PVZ1_9PEZI|nr:glycoside hydrolase family 18 protein [Parathielavia hyrcaniae]